MCTSSGALSVSVSNNPVICSPTSRPMCHRPNHNPLLSFFCCRPPKLPSHLLHSLALPIVTPNKNSKTQETLYHSHMPCRDVSVILPFISLMCLQSEMSCYYYAAALVFRIITSVRPLVPLSCVRILLSSLHTLSTTTSDRYCVYRLHLHSIVIVLHTCQCNKLNSPRLAFPVVICYTTPVSLVWMSHPYHVKHSHTLSLSPHTPPIRVHQPKNLDSSIISLHCDLHLHTRSSYLRIVPHPRTCHRVDHTIDSR